MIAAGCSLVRVRFAPPLLENRLADEAPGIVGLAS